jgi:hypothetical protein
MSNYYIWSALPLKTYQQKLLKPKKIIAGSKGGPP